MILIYVDTSNVYSPRYPENRVSGAVDRLPVLTMRIKQNAARVPTDP